MGLIEPVDQLTPSYLAQLTPQQPYHKNVKFLLTTAKNAFLNHKIPYLQNDLYSQRGHVSTITVNHQVVLKLP